MANTDLIKKLRENTGCGMSDCNKALKENNDDYEKAVEWLRKKGLSSAAKKSSRVTAEGVIGIENSGKDVYKFAEILKTTKCEKCNDVVSNIVANAVATIGENLQVRRGKTLHVDNGLIVSYIHTAVAQGLGKIGVLVALKSGASTEQLEELGKGIAMHIAATKPEFLKESDVPATKLDSEKEIARELAKKAGKPENIVEKMVDGRIKKFYEENVLLNQAYVMDNNKKISDLLKEFEKNTGKTVEIQDYVFFVLGEGIEKKENDFAAEVASMTGNN